MRAAKISLVLVVLAAAVMGAVALCTCALAAEEPDPTQAPSVTKVVTKVPMEEVPFYDGDQPGPHQEWRGIGLQLHPVRGSKYESRAPRLVSSRALYAPTNHSEEEKDASPIVFFLDETGGADSGYNRLYFDRNADGRFGADEYAGLVANPPSGATASGPSGRISTAFEPFELRVSPSAPPRRCAARFRLPSGGLPEYLEVGWALRHAKLTIGSVECSVFAASRFPGDYADASTYMLIRYPPDGIVQLSSGTSWSLDGAVYRLSASAGGDTLTVEEYVGPAGTVVVERSDAYKGMRIGKVEMEPSVVATRGLLDERGEFRAPAGEYMVYMLSLTKGQCSCLLLHDFSQGKEPTKDVKVSDGGRFALTLSSVPRIEFLKATPSPSVRPGDELRVDALVKCPKWDLCIRYVSTPIRRGEVGRTSSYSEPKLTIKDAAGHVLAEASMPYG